MKPTATFASIEHISPFSRLRIWLLSRLWPLLIRLHSAAWRKNCESRVVLDRLMRERKPFIGIFWHGKYATLFPLFRGIRVCAFTSTSPQGQIIAEIARSFGYHAVGIPDHGGEESMTIMRTSLAGAGEPENGAIAVDGPTGPYHEVKAGAVRLASELGHLIVPVSAASQPKQVAQSRWDKMEFPRLFSRVCMAVGEPVAVPPDLTESQVADWSAELRKLLEATDQIAENMAAKR